MFPMMDHQLFLYHDVATVDLTQYVYVYMMPIIDVFPFAGCQIEDHM